MIKNLKKKHPSITITSIEKRTVTNYFHSLGLTNAELLACHPRSIQAYPKLLRNGGRNKLSKAKVAASSSRLSGLENQPLVCREVTDILDSFTSGSN